MLGNFIIVQTSYSALTQIYMVEPSIHLGYEGEPPKTEFIYTKLYLFLHV